MVEFIVFAVSAAIVLGGALGVVGFRNPVHNALSLIATLFGVAVLFIAQEAQFPRRRADHRVRWRYRRAVPVRHHVVGVDRSASRPTTPRASRWCRRRRWGHRRADRVGVVRRARPWGSTTPRSPARCRANDGRGGLPGWFTDYGPRSEITSALLGIAVVAAVLLSRRSSETPIDADDYPEVTDIFEPAIAPLDPPTESVPPPAIDTDSAAAERPMSATRTRRESR
ncbi:MAG: hypothetical protein R2704_12810 [Microthrixaceae bacterium]